MAWGKVLRYVQVPRPELADLETEREAVIFRIPRAVAEGAAIDVSIANSRLSQLGGAVGWDARGEWPSQCTD